MKIKLPILLSILFVSFFESSLYAQLSIVKDINDTGDARPQGFTIFRDEIFFSANDGANGFEFWKSNGTEEGTSLLKDIYQGASDGFPVRFIQLGEQLIMSAEDNFSGRELWITNGTEEGTNFLFDINPGMEDSSPSDFTLLNNKVFFTAKTEISGRELWLTNGLANGTRMVKDISLGETSTDIRDLITYNGNLYFTADDGINGLELWTSDGTESGTQIVLDIFEGEESSFPSNHINYNGNMVFAASNLASGRELWVSDGTSTGTKLLKEINPGPLDSSPSLFYEYNGSLFFKASTENEGRELWISDGTEEGTVLLKDLRPGPESANPSAFVEFNDALYFFANAGQTSRQSNGLWKTDGTEEGTEFIKEVLVATGSAFDPSFDVLNDKLYFRGDDQSGEELWISDGTTEGTKFLIDIFSGETNGFTNDGFPDEIFEWNGKLLFRARNSEKGSELHQFVPPNVNITDFEPKSGIAGDEIQIIGTSFGSEITDNIVYFGDLIAEIVSTSSTELRVIVPDNVINSPIEVEFLGEKAISNENFNLLITTVNEIEETPFFFPNPVSKNLHLNSTPINIQIFNANGTQIKAHWLVERGSNKTKVDMSQLAKGLYIVRYLNNNRWEAATVIKE